MKAWKPIHTFRIYIFGILAVFVFLQNLFYSWFYINKGLNVIRFLLVLLIADNNNMLLHFISEGGTVSILGGNLTVKHGDQAVFVCVASGWFPEAQVYWSMNGTMVDTENYNTSVEAIGTLLNSTSTLTVSAVGSAQVQCLAKVPALFIPQTSSVFLIVGKNKILSHIDFQ